MLEYNKIDISEWVDVNKTKKSKECMLCHYWSFLDKDFSYGSYLCDSYYNMMQKSIYFNKNAYRIQFWCMSKRKAIRLMTNSNLIDKKGVL